MADNNTKQACKYGKDCYQQNQAHKDRFSHPKNDKAVDVNRRSNSPPTKRRKSSSEDDSGNENHDQNESLEEIESSSSGNSSKKEDVTLASTTENLALRVEKTLSSSSTEYDSVSTRCSEFIKENYDKGPHSHRGEYFELLKSPADFILEKFLVKMPTDFFALWEFCELESKNNSKPENYFTKFGLSLVGPFDVLSKKFHDIQPFEPGSYLRHWRFYYDPPEFQTLFVKEKTGIHYGYWRDEPNGECLIARNDATKNCEFTFVSDNLFGAILYYLEKDVQLSPFNKSSAQSLKKSIEDFAHRKSIALTTFSAKLKARNLKTVCKTFHKAGLSVPYNRKTDVGYRQLGESDANLKKILSKFEDVKGNKELITAAMDKLQPLITAANIACDESDFGNALELGIDLFCFGVPELHSDALQLLVTGYKMVKKPQFIAIIKAHLEKRIKGISGLSILDFAEPLQKLDSTKLDVSK